MPTRNTEYIAFDHHSRIACGDLAQVLRKVRQTSAANANARVLVFERHSSEQVEFDPRCATAQAVRDAAATTAPGSGHGAPEPAAGAPPPKPGRPKLGVVAREVTLLPRHWQWLASQPGGASVALRKLVEQARRDNRGADKVRQAQEVCYRFMSAIAGDLPGFEEIARALFAPDAARFEELLAPWPADIGAHLRELAAGAFETQTDGVTDAS